jgi:hypothetical protein
MPAPGLLFAVTESGISGVWYAGLVMDSVGLT